jgi:streptomycin 6-kinase
MQNSVTHPVQIPTALIQRVERVHGAAGRQWLAKLPDLLSACCTRWSLELDQPFENLSYNLVLPGRISPGRISRALFDGVTGSTQIVLKLGVPCRELVTESAALALFQGVGAVRLLDYDSVGGALLMERVTPGTSLHNLQRNNEDKKDNINKCDAEATRIAAALMRRLWREPPANHPFPSLEIWFEAFKRLRTRFAGGTGPFPGKLIAAAEKVFADLSASSDRSVILHGDLHHENILYSQKGEWLAIDPKGICGDPGYEIGSFMLNQLPAGEPAATIELTMEILSRRLSIFSEELGIGIDRLARWAFCHAMLSALWDFEESAEWDRTIRLAQMLARL